MRPPLNRPEPAGPLEVEVLETGAGVVVRLRGEAGVAEVGLLGDSLWRLPARRPARVTFDLSELRSISSLALRVLAAHRRAAVRAGARVCLAPGLHPAVRAALDKVELVGLFEAVGGAEPGAAPWPAAEAARTQTPDRVLREPERSPGCLG